MMRESHGGDVWTASRLTGIDVYGILDFSSNVNDFSPLLHNCSECEKSLLLYPDPEVERYTEGLCSYNNIEMEKVILVPGLTYAIYRFLTTVGRKKVAVGTPTFSEYRKTTVVGSKVIYIPFTDIADKPELVTNLGSNVVFLVSPANPTGDLISNSRLRKILEYFSLHDVFLFLDEAFIEFVGQDAARNDASLVDEFPNLFIGRSLSKVSGLPSFRLGYIITNRDNASLVREKIEPWAVSQHALHLLSKIDFRSIEVLPRLVSEVKRGFINEMEQLQFQVIGKPEANFVSFRIPEKTNPEELLNALLSRGILVRSLWNYPEFGINYIRVAIKKEKKMKLLLEALRDILEKG